MRCFSICIVCIFYCKKERVFVILVRVYVFEYLLLFGSLIGEYVYNCILLNDIVRRGEGLCLRLV